MITLTPDAIINRAIRFYINDQSNRAFIETLNAYSRDIDSYADSIIAEMIDDNDMTIEMLEIDDSIDDDSIDNALRAFSRMIRDNESRILDALIDAINDRMNAID